MTQQQLLEILIGKAPPELREPLGENVVAFTVVRGKNGEGTCPECEAKQQIAEKALRETIDSILQCGGTEKLKEFLKMLDGKRAYAYDLIELHKKYDPTEPAAAPKTVSPFPGRSTEGVQGL